MEYGAKKMLYDAIVIGGGPAGMFGAIMMKRHFRRVAILEKNDRLGKKLLLSGSTQCNLTHSGSTKEFICKYGSKGPFLKPAIKGFDNKSLLSFFEDKEIRFEERTGGKFFPTSGKALDILYVLEKELEKNSVDVFLSEKVLGVSKTENGFRVETKDLILDSKVLVLATGGMSYPSTGSSGDGYTFAKMLGHTIVPVKPALSPVVCKDFRGRHLAGLSFEQARLGLWRKGKKESSFKGALLFTHDGLSGPAILNNSRTFELEDRLVINYLQGQDKASFERELTDRASQKNPPRIKRYLKSFDLTDRFCIDRMNNAGIEEDLCISELAKEARKSLASCLTEDVFTIKEVKGFHIAMVTAGGVDTKEINRKTMESKKVKGLFFAGEIIDIDGETGGYNLQAAFSTAWLIANAANNVGNDNK